jgi:archaellum component FlaC
MSTPPRGKRLREEFSPPPPSPDKDQSLDQWINTHRDSLLLMGGKNMDNSKAIAFELLRALFDRVEKLEEAIKNRDKMFDEIENALEEIREDIPVLQTQLEEHAEELKNVKESNNKQELQAYFEERIREEVKKIKPSSSNQPEKAEVGFFVTGVKKLREIVECDSEADPCDVIHTTLHGLGAAPYYTRIVPILPPSKIRKEVETAIVYFSSVYHRKWAAAEMRKNFARQKIRGVGVRDLFEKEDVDMSKQLTKAGFVLRSDNKIKRFRVSNIGGKPTLLCASDKGGYKAISDQLRDATLAKLRNETS